eukprot:197743_1
MAGVNTKYPNDNDDDTITTVKKTTDENNTNDTDVDTTTVNNDFQSDEKKQTTITEDKLPSIVIDENDIGQKQLKQLGYFCNKNGQILRISDNKPYKAHTSKDINAAIVSYIDHLYVTHYKLQKIVIEEKCIESKENDTFEYISPGYIYKTETKYKTLLVIITGLGTDDRTGIWSFRLCCSDSILFGTAFEYIDEAKKRNWDIIMFDPNGPSPSRRKYPNISMIETRSDEKHCIDMFQKHIIDTENINKYDKIYFIGFSMGGRRTSRLLNHYSENKELFDKIKGIAFIDAVGIGAANDWIKNNIYKKYAVNYRRKKKNNYYEIIYMEKPIHSKGVVWKEDSAGHSNHSWTPYCAREKVFHQFEK